MKGGSMDDEEPDWSNIMECIDCNLMFDTSESYEKHMKDKHERR
jgi:uncharacterized C2H2 Zn-finger protein